MDAPWRIELLGGIRAIHAARAIDRFRTHKTAALLAYLAYFSDRSHAREELIRRFWPEAGAEAGSVSLRQALSSLRRQLEAPGVPRGSVIVADHRSVRLNPEAISTDVALFEAALRAPPRPETLVQREQRLNQAIGLYQGALLLGWDEDWVLEERQRLNTLYFDALEQLLSILEQRDDLVRAQEYARRGARIDPALAETRPLMTRLLNAPEPTTSAVSAEGARATPIEDEERVEPDGRPLPAGTVVFILTEAEEGPSLPRAVLTDYQMLLGSFWRDDPEAHPLLADRETLCVAFGRASAALAAAVAAQRALAQYQRPGRSGGLRVRMALHVGEVGPGQTPVATGDFERAQCLLLAAHGGQILLSEKTATLLRDHLPDNVRLEDLGLYRVDESASPEHLFQASYDRMVPEQFPPPTASPVGYLPLPLTRFFGRESELEQLEAMLCPDSGAGQAGPSIHQRLVTLTGPGGTGKTRLGQAAAGRLMGAFRGTVWLVPLADLTGAPHLGEALRQALRLPHSPDAEPLEQAADVLSRQPSLLLLDNFEHLLPEGAALLHRLLEQVPTLACLVTSRQRLAIEGEREFLVGPLSTPDEVPTAVQEAGAPTSRRPLCSPSELAAISQNVSVQLFVDRAQATRPDFQITAANAASVAALCRCLEGIPLALELAAARARALSPAQILVQLKRRFDFLVSRQAGTLPRHQSLRAALDWSYERLPPDLQRFFARLSAFRGGWTLEAAEAVGQEPRAWEFLEQLREASMVLVEEDGPALRYRLLESLREFGAEKLLAAGDTPATRSRHLDYFLMLAVQCEPDLHRGSNRQAALERLEAEQDNLRAALDWAEEVGTAPGGGAPLAAGLRLAAALDRFWYFRGYLPEGRERLARLLALPDGEGRQAGQSPEVAHERIDPRPRSSIPGASEAEPRARALIAAGWLAQNHGDRRAARGWYEAALELSLASGLKREAATTLQYLAMATEKLGDGDAARALLEDCLSLRRELDDQAGTAEALLLLGVISFSYDRDRSRRLLEESLAIRTETGDRSGMASCLRYLGRRHLDEGSEAARGLYEQSLMLCREASDLDGIGYSLLQLGRLAAEQGDLVQAQACFQEMRAAWERLGNRPEVARALLLLAEIDREQGDYPGARALLSQALSLQQELGSRGGKAPALFRLAKIAVAEGKETEARLQFEQAIAQRRPVEKLPLALQLESKAAELLRAPRQSEAAQSEWDQAIRTAGRLAGPPDMPLPGLHLPQERAALLRGAAAALREAAARETASPPAVAPRPPELQAANERRLAHLGEALGEERYLAIQEQGRALSEDQIVWHLMWDERW